MITEARIREIVREEFEAMVSESLALSGSSASKLPRLSREEAIRQQREGVDPALLCRDEPIPAHPIIRGGDPW